MSLGERTKYWIDLAKEDMTVAQVLINSGKLLYAGLMCHLAVEKALKARIESIGETPLRIHNLIRLAEIGGILDLMTDQEIELLALLNPLQIEARYPAHKQQIVSHLTMEQCGNIIARSGEMIQWIEKQL
jgi:HEPN domain-containing protein